MDRPRRNDPRMRRAAVVRIYEVADRMVVLAPDGAGHELTGDSAALARAVLEFLESAHTADEVKAELISREREKFQAALRKQKVEETRSLEGIEVNQAAVSALVQAAPR